MIAAWPVFLLLLGLLSLGSGLLVERASGERLPGVLLLPVGLASIVVVTQLATFWDLTAELATPLVVIAAVAGFASSRARLRQSSPDGWALALAAAVLAVFAAPVVLSGQATFAGYTQLGDSAIHFVLIDRMMEHGTETDGLPPSSYSAALQAYFDTGYPTGSQTALGAVRPLVGQDVAWVFQPFIAFMAMLAALAIYWVARTVVERRALAALVAAIAAQTALVYGFSLQGSIKEIATVWLIALAVALVPLAIRGRNARAVIPLAIAAAAGGGVLRLAIVPWLGPVLAAFLVAMFWQSGRAGLRSAASKSAVLVATIAALSVPTIAVADEFLRTNDAINTDPGEKGNLVEPLEATQVFGIWPSRDFRFDPHYPELTVILIGAAVIGTLIGFAWLARRRSALALLYLGASLIGSVYVTARGSPWVDAKALMVLSPVVVLIAMLGAVTLLERGRRAAGAVLAAAIAFGVLFTNAVAYHYVPLAPRERLAELARIGEQIKGDGPSLYTEWEEFGKHFLRDGAPTGHSEPWQWRSQRGEFGQSYDVDELPLQYVLDHRTLVLRRSPSISRPPSPYRRVLAGTYYEVWRRADERTRVVSHASLGEGVQAAAALPCRQVDPIAARARRSRAEVAYVARQPSLAVLPPGNPALASAGRDPPSTVPYREFRDQSARATFFVRPGGRYELWLGGSLGRGFRVVLDGNDVGTASYELNGPGQYTFVAGVALDPGPHVVELKRGGTRLRPGNGSGDRQPGAIILAPESAAARRVEQRAASEARELCDRDLDWVEVVEGG